MPFHKKEAQEILRNKWGKVLESVIGVSPILPKEQIFEKLNANQKKLSERIGLTFNSVGEVVVGFIDVEKYITLFLCQPGVQGAINTPRNLIIVYDYTDAFPWLKWSRHFFGETSVRIKLVEPYNLLSTVLTAALWLGSDDYDTVRQCGEPMYKQLQNLKSIKHPGTGEEIVIHRRSRVDGKERRTSNGSSSAKSRYPIPEDPEHQSQLGNMKIRCPRPV